jgi:predicted DNA-binding transcriptional regulator AlpA
MDRYGQSINYPTTPKSTLCFPFFKRGPLMAKHLRGAPTAGGADEVFLSSQQVRSRYGGISDMTLWKWLKDDGYPKPMTMGTRRYWRLSDIVAFEIQQTGKKAPKNPNLGRPKKIKEEAMEE